MSTKVDSIVMGMGNPLLDISAEVGQDMLDKYSVKLDSAILAEEKHLPMYNELIEKYSPQYIAGGATQNSIRVAQWMLTNAGYEKNTCAFMGCVGTDSNGDKLQSCAESDGVLVHYLKDTEHPTGTCAVLVKDGERSLIANLGAANHFKKAHLETALARGIVNYTRILYVAGFFLTVSPESLEYVLRVYVVREKIFAMNLSAPFIVEFFSEQLTKALPFCDYVFGNETEAEAFGKKFELGSDLKEVALKLSAMEGKINPNRKRTVVFTQGSKPTIVACNGTVTEYPVAIIGKAKLVDTNGAGDAFVGGFLAALAHDKGRYPFQYESLHKKAVEAGHYAARYIIQQSGCTLSDKCTYFDNE